MGDPVADRFEYLAGETAGRWAQRILADQDDSIEMQTVAAVVLHLRAQVAELRERADRAEKLAYALGSDMLDALMTELLDGEHDMKPIGYIARGWMRDHTSISLSDCSEGRQVTERLEQLPADHFAADVPTE